ncbi:gastrula zinc finger protein xLCGF3.1 [Octopus bimaculoides]|uniref:C2H2-type domain-containing protein n=1 Tax=Octopus bimaculoides TaxID=37653 RepID=A0A0L8GJS5_OCTBM|nr:gastrula zinc finger protein xLCGF3.1 [Octopus bimaculoides]XP_014780705.1 gastrula zinc finger protein xLCGF3.1 [Octopus bimaculoides]|eukprot:XP_014780704.1 PREDICTED: gastrula zinc finger protein xLCGF3.1-like [Octopus bimaculoides]
MKDELHADMLCIDKSNINTVRVSENDFHNGILVTPQAAIASSSSSSSLTSSSSSITSSSSSISSSSSSSVGLSHSNPHSFTCDICGKMLSRRDHLKLHKTIHTGVRPYRCETCGCTFSRNHHLMRHMGSHLSEKRFKCDICGKALSRSDHLKVHRRIHTGERPFKCQICGFAFSRRDRLVKHNQLSKGKRKLSCVPPNFTAQTKELTELDNIEMSISNQLIVNLNPAIPSLPQCHQQSQRNSSNDSDPSDKTHKETAYVFLDSSTSNCKQESTNAHQVNNQCELPQQEIVKNQSTNLTINQSSLPAQISEILVPEENTKMPIILANSGQVASVLPVFPTTVQMTPAIFPALQMYTSAAPLSIPSPHIYVTK